MEAYNEILQRMTDRYTQLTGVVPDEASDIAVRLRLLAGELYTTKANIQWLKRQIFADTADGDYLDMHAATRSIIRRSATKAVGEVTFSAAAPAVAAITIPSGTVVATAGSEPLRFVTSQSAAIAVGQSSVTVPATAQYAGRRYNVRANTVCVAVTPPSGISSVTNASPFYSGTDTETDQSLRQRVKESFKTPSNGTNCAYYKGLVTSVDGVMSAGVVPRARGVGTVNIYIAGDGTAVSPDMLAAAQSLVSEMREINVDALVLNAAAETVDIAAEIEVEDGYDFEAVRADCVSAVETYINSRGVGGDMLLVSVGECIYHVPGVREYYLSPDTAGNIRGVQSIFTVAGTVTVTRGISD